MQLLTVFSASLEFSKGNCLYSLASTDRRTIDSVVLLLHQKTQSVPTGVFSDSISCCIIKPHAVHHSGSILLDLMQQGFSFRAMQMLQLSRDAADDFLDVYKTVVADYAQVMRDAVGYNQCNLDL